MNKGIAAAFVAYFLFSSADACIKTLGSQLPVFEILFFIMVADFLTLGFAKPGNERWRDAVRVHRPKLIAARAVLATIAGLCNVYAFTTLPLAEAYALIFLLPMFTTILSIPILGEEVGWRRWSAVAIVLRILGPTESRISLLTAVYATSVVVNGLLMIPGFVAPQLRDFAFIAYVELAGGIGQILMIVAARLVPVSQIVSVQYVQIIWAVIFGAVFFGEVPDWIAFVGMVLVGVSGVITILREGKLHGWSRRLLLLRNRPDEV